MTEETQALVRQLEEWLDGESVTYASVLMQDAAAALASLSRDLSATQERNRELRAELKSAAERESARVVEAHEKRDFAQQVASLSRDLETAKAERWFPIQLDRKAKAHPIRVPWSVAEKAYSVYSARYGTSQTLERLAERGGFSPDEMDDMHPNWRMECDEIVRLRADLETARQERDTALKQRNAFDRECKRLREQARQVADNQPGHTCHVSGDTCGGCEYALERDKRIVAAVRAARAETWGEAVSDLTPYHESGDFGRGLESLIRKWTSRTAAREGQ